MKYLYSMYVQIRLLTNLGDVRTCVWCVNVHTYVYMYMCVMYVFVYVRMYVYEC